MTRIPDNSMSMIGQVRFLISDCNTATNRCVLCSNNVEDTQPSMYSGNLNNKHLNNVNIWMMNFHLSGIQMLGIQMMVWITD